MGSVGSSGIKGISVEINGVTRRYQNINGKVYETSGTTPTPVNRTLAEIESRAKSQRLKYSTLSSRDLANQEKQRQEQRKESDRILNQAYVGDRTFVKGSRSSRITNRANKRRK